VNNIKNMDQYDLLETFDVCVQNLFDSTNDLHIYMLLKYLKKNNNIKDNSELTKINSWIDYIEATNEFKNTWSIIKDCINNIKNMETFDSIVFSKNGEIHYILFDPEAQTEKIDLTKNSINKIVENIDNVEQQTEVGMINYLE
jgi:hypothetical protein